MPLTFVKAGQSGRICRITGKDQTRRFLNGLGFLEGETVTIVSENGGNLILQVKDARIAIDRSMASRIQIA